jgi:effector-binding domain-containing protein
MKNGTEKAFLHLATLQKEMPTLLSSCHYISHGIGHATFRLVGKDVGEAFSVLENRGYYKNIATCGNGYFHGVIEEFSKNTKNLEELGNKLKTVCDNKKITNKGNCFHGVGHASIIQTDYNIENSLKICDSISNKENEQFGCWTGVFMEYDQLFEVVKVNEGKIYFEVCDALVNDKYKPACYLEQSSNFESYAKNWRDYANNINYCKHIRGDLNRMACVKLFAIRAIRIVRYEKITEMCANTSNKYEQIICTAISADRIARSSDYARTGQTYQTAIEEVCNTLDFLKKPYCIYILNKEKDKLFYTSEQDFVLPSLWKVLH